MKKSLLLVALAALFALCSCQGESLENTVWLYVDSTTNTTGSEVLTRDSITLDFISNDEGKWKHVHRTDRNNDVERVTFFYTFDGSHGAFSVYDTYEFDIRGESMEVHKQKDVPFGDTLIYTKIYSE